MTSIYILATSSWYNATGPRCHIFVDSSSSRLNISEEYIIFIASTMLTFLSSESHSAIHATFDGRSR